MKIEKYIYKQIKQITASLTETSFQIAFNFPAEKDGVITWSGYKNISFSLRNQPYEDLYNSCIQEQAYNFILIDGAIVQLMYECKNNIVIKHRLAFFPNPNTERFQDSPEDFEEIYFGKELFSEIYERKVVVFPIRIDFDNDQKKYVEHDHSFAHITLGNYKNCRIPVSKPLSPNKFILFILRSFYFDRFQKYYKNENFDCNYVFEECITDNERKFVHLNH